MDTREETPLYPESHAFVIQFQRSEQDGERPGRVEHVSSGRAGRFRTGAELMEFIAGVLGR